MTSRFPSASVNPTLQQDTGVNYVLACGFSVDSNVDVIGVYYYSPQLQPHPVTVHLFENGTAGPIASKGPLDLVSGDNEILFDTPVTLVPGDSSKEYYVGIEFSGASGANVYYTATVLTTPLTEEPFTTPGKNDASHVGFFTTSVPVSTNPETAFTGGTNWYGVAAIFNNPAPPTTLVVNAGSDQTGTTDTLVSITATETGETGTVAWAWTKLSGPTVTLSGTNTPTVTFTPTTAGTYVLRATGTDDLGSSSDDVQIVVTAPSVLEGILWVQDPSNNNWIRIKSADTPALITTPGKFRVADYIDSAAPNDNAAAQLAVNAAVEAAGDYNGQVDVVFDSREYVFGTAPNTGADGYENGQLTIPHVVGSTTKKVVLTLKGGGNNAVPYYWGQHQAQSIGTVLKSTQIDSVGGSSVISGPTNLGSAPQDDFSTFSNMTLVVDGILIQTPYNSLMTGINAKLISQLVVPNAGHFSDRSRFTSPVIADPGNATAAGLIMPMFGNNARNEIGTFVVEGIGVGVVIGEHCKADYIATVYCYKGIIVGTGSSAAWPDGRPKVLTHSVTIDQFLAEAVQCWVSQSGEGHGQLVIGAVDGEGVPSIAHVDDPNSLLHGEIASIVDIYSEDIIVNGAKNLRIVNGNIPRGSISAPTVPVSGTPLRNPFWRDASVYISGGSVTQISVDGTVTGLTSGLIRVSTGQAVTLTYSSAPTWAWVLD